MKDFCVVFCDDDYVLTGKKENTIKASFNEIKRGLRLFTYTNGEKLVKDIKDGIIGIIDILFLDIEMPGMNGIEVKDILVKDTRVRRIVFLTSHAELAIPAFGLKVVAFLEKPIADDKLNHTIMSIERELRMDNAVKYRYGKKENAFDIKELIYISTGKKGTILHFLDDVDLETSDLNLNYWEKIFKDDCVIRVHKSYMINLYYVEAFKYSTIYLNETDAVIPVGRVFSQRTRYRIDKFQEIMIEKRML